MAESQESLLFLRCYADVSAFTQEIKKLAQISQF